MEAVAVVDVNIIKLDVQDIHIIGIGKAPVQYVFHQHVSEDRIIDITDLRMELLSAYTVITVAGVNIVGVEVRAPPAQSFAGAASRFLQGTKNHIRVHKKSVRLAFHSQ